MRLWDLRDGSVLRQLRGHVVEKHLEVAVRSVAITADGRRALSGSGDETARLWDLETGQELRRLQAHTNQVWSVALTPDGRQGVTASLDGTACLWNLEAE